ncbi:hypothetical protein TruAng_004033 [Truncatella angustata]|nr:hypothetical protein TruAng_004033 [Truncatella angustata]
MESVSTPRISSRYIDSYVGRTVMVVGKVIQLRGNEALIDSDGQINVNLNPQCHLTPGNGVQVIGKVSSDLTIKVMSSVDLGDNVVSGGRDTPIQGALRLRAVTRRCAFVEPSSRQHARTCGLALAGGLPTRLLVIVSPTSTARWSAGDCADSSAVLATLLISL